VALDPLLKKYFLAVVLGLVALAAYFQAAGATQLLGAALLAPAAPASAAQLQPASVPGLHRELRSAEPIIERNPFDSVTGPLNAPPVPTIAPPAEPDLSDPLAAPACDGVSAFIITESNDPTWSVAALQASGETHPRMRRVGDDVGGKQVTFIGFNPRENSPSVWLTSGSQLCQCMLFRSAEQAQAAAAAPPPAPVAEAPPPPPPRGGANPVPPEIASKIQKVSDNEFNVDRSVVDKILENQAELMRSARIVPEQKDGKVVGVRLFGIRPDTLLGTLGLQNGDRLETINGFNMASPEKALEAYARLRTSSNLAVKVNRRGSPVNIEYRIK
jgi:general secretion pathway protein C